MLMKNVILSVLLVTLFIGCKEMSGNKSNENEKKLIVDALNRKVWVPKNPKNIAGVNSGTLRMLTYVATEMVSAVEQSEGMGIVPYNLINPELADKKKIGPRHGGDAELIIKANLDILFSSYTTTKDVDALQKKIGIPVVCIANAELAAEKDKWFSSISLIGEVLNKEKEANLLIEYVDSNIKELDKRTKQFKGNDGQPRVYIGGVSARGSHGITSTRPFYPPFEFVNIDNVASALAEGKSLIKHTAFIDKEKLLMWNPDIIYVDGGGLELSKKDLSPEQPLYKNLKAVQNDKMYLLYPHNYYNANYEMVLVNAWYVAKTLYPEEFKDINFDKKLEEILKAFYRKEVSSKQFQIYFKPLTKEELQ